MELLKKKQRQSTGTTAVVDAPEPETAQIALEDLQPETVQVISGAMAQDLQLTGLRVSQARDLLGRALGIDRRAPALVNGMPVDANYELRAGDVLEFVHPAGEKGARHERSD